MKESNKEEKYYKTIADEQNDTPPSFVWDKIEEQLPQKKKSRPWILFMFFGFALLFTFFTGIFKYENIKEETIAPFKGSTDIESSEERSIASKNDFATIVTENFFPSSVTNSKQVFTNQKSISTELEISNQTFLNKKNRKSKFNKTLEHVTIPYTTSNSFTYSEVDINELMTNSKFYSRPESEDVTVDFISSEHKVDNSGTKNLQLQSANVARRIKQITSLERKMNLLEGPYSIPTIGLMRLSKVRNRAVLKLDDNSGLRNNFFIDIGLIAGTHNTHLQNINDTLIDYRSSTESNWYTWGLNLHIGYNLSDRVYIKSGFEFIESRDKFDFYKTEATLEEVMQTNKNFKVTTGTYFNKGDITYRQVNIPLTLGVIMHKNRYLIGLEGTSLLNVGFRSEGKIRTGLLAFSRVEDGDIYKSCLGLGMKAAVTLGKKVTKNGTLFLKPTYSKYFEETNNRGVSQKTNLSQYYMEVLYRYKF